MWFANANLHSPASRTGQSGESAGIGNRAVVMYRVLLVGPRERAAEQDLLW